MFQKDEKNIIGPGIGPLFFVHERGIVSFIVIFLYLVICVTYNFLRNSRRARRVKRLNDALKRQERLRRYII